jgi:hypothetical protein
MTRDSVTQDMFSGEDLRNAGINSVIAHNMTFKEQLTDIIAGLAKGTRFTSDDLHLWCISLGINDPKHHNAWGGTVFRMATAGLTKSVDTVKSGRPSARKRTIHLWERL